MKQVTKALCLGLIACLFAVTTQGLVLHDDFNGSTIDTSLWQASAYFSDSAMTVTGGNAVFQNRGRLLSLASLPTSIEVMGRFEFAGSIHDQFMIQTRTDGTSTNPWGEFDLGIRFGFQMQGDPGNTANNISIVHNGYPGVSFILAQGTFPIAQNTFYDFRITDDGTNFALYIGDLTTPLLTGTDSLASGNRLGISNREGAAGGSTISAGSIVHLDYLTVIPEPSTFALAGLGVVALLGGLRLRRRA